MKLRLHFSPISKLLLRLLCTTKFEIAMVQSNLTFLTWHVIDTQWRVARLHALWCCRHLSSQTSFGRTQVRFELPWQTTTLWPSSSTVPSQGEFPTTHLAISCFLTCTTITDSVRSPNVTPLFCNTICLMTGTTMHRVALVRPRSSARAAPIARPTDCARTARRERVWTSTLLPLTFLRVCMYQGPSGHSPTRARCRLSPTCPYFQWDGEQFESPRHVRLVVVARLAAHLHLLCLSSLQPQMKECGRSVCDARCVCPSGSNFWVLVLSLR